MVLLCDKLLWLYCVINCYGFIVYCVLLSDKLLWFYCRGKLLLCDCTDKLGLLCDKLLWFYCVINCYGFIVW